MLGRAISANLTKVLGTLLVVGIAGSTVSYGTFATFTAQTSNAGNTFSTGSLILTNQKLSGSTCLASGSGGGVNTNVNTACDTLFTAGSGAGLAPGGSVVTAQVGIHNSGTLSASTLKLHADACGATDNTAVPAGQRGTGNPCGSVNIAVFNETTSTCVFPGAGACTSSSAPTSSGTLANFNGSGAPLTVAAPLAAGNGVTFTFAIQVDSAAGNSMMGRQATTTFHWQATQ